MGRWTRFIVVGTACAAMIACIVIVVRRHADSTYAVVLHTQNDGVHDVMCLPSNVVLGHLPAGSTSRTQFLIRNDGDRAVRVLHVRSSCGCVVPRLARETIPPHSEIAVDVTVQSGYETGSFAREIVVQTDRGDAQLLKVDISGEVYAGYTVVPSRIIATSGAMSGEIQRSVDVLFLNGERFGIVSWAANVPGVHAAVTALPGNNGHHVAISMDVKAEISRVEGIVELRTDTRNMTIRIPVLCDFERELRVSPREIVIGESGAEKMVTRYVQVSPGTVSNFNITEIIPPSATLRVSAIKKLSAGGYIVTIQQVASERVDAGHVFRIRTDAPNMGEIDIPVVYR